MDRRNFLKHLTAGSVALSLSAIAKSHPTIRPNILFVMADDHTRAAASCYGSKTIQTPNIDRIAQQGMKFNHMMVTNALCAPSRAVLLTGKYNHCNGYLHNGQKFDGSQQTFPKLLRKAGYETAIVGKWHLQTEPTGFDHYLVMPGHGRYTNCPLKEKGKPWMDGYRGGTPYEGYLTDIITDQSIAWLEERSSDKPFCLMVHHKAPHGPHEPAPRHKDLFADDVIPEPPTLLDDYQGRAPSTIEDTLIFSRMAICHYNKYKEAVEKYAGSRKKATRHLYQNYMKGYLRLVAALDENVGRLLDYLDKTGLRENTVVIYTSDNGFFNGEHGFFNKMWMYEESLHVPMLVRYPDTVVPGAENGHLVSMLDLAPTFLELAGATVPHDMQGTSILPLLKGETPPWRDAVYYHYYAQFETPEQYGVRTQTHKLVHYPESEQGPPWELFDLVNDPQEMTNLADDPAYASLLREMKARLRQLRLDVKETLVAGKQE